MAQKLGVPPETLSGTPQNGPRGSNMARNDGKPQKLGPPIEKIKFWAIFGPNFDHFRPKMGQNGPFLAPKWPFWAIFDPFLAENGQNLAQKWPKM